MSDYKTYRGTKAVMSMRGLDIPWDKIKPGELLTMSGLDSGRKYKVFRRDFKRGKIHLRRIFE